MNYKDLSSFEWWENAEILCEDTSEKVQGYKEYLKTRHWKEKRIEIYRKYDRHCQHCGRAIQLRDANVHHLTYEHVGSELDEDLILLCHECHEKVHGVTHKKRTKRSWKEKDFRRNKKKV